MKEVTNRDYQERVIRVLTYIQNHLGENLDLNKLAEIANFSPYHFHRIMRAFLNEPLWSYIVRTRLETSVWMVDYSNMSIQEIALKVGYDSVASFNKAFKNRFGVAPTELKEKRSELQFRNFVLNLNLNAMKLEPKIKEVKPKKVIFIQSIEPYGGKKMQESWTHLFEFMKKNRLFGFGMETIGISYDDPTVTEPEKLRYDACITISKDVKPEGNIGVKTLDGGKFAVFHYKGPYEGFSDVYNYIFRTWLPSSNYELRDTNCYENYLNDPGKTKPESLKTDIYVPLK